METKKLVIQSKRYKGESSIVSTRLPIELVRKIDQIASEVGKTRNELIISCLEYAMDNIIIEN